MSSEKDNSQAGKDEELQEDAMLNWGGGNYTVTPNKPGASAELPSGTEPSVAVADTGEYGQAARKFLGKNLNG